jgi:hypothetical protein
MTPADTGFDNQFERFEEQLRAIVKDASLQPRLAEDLHGSEDVQSLLSRHSDQDSSERKAIDSPGNRKPFQANRTRNKKATLARGCPLPNRDRYWCCSHAGLAVLRRDNQADNRDKGSGTWLVVGDKADDHQLDAAAWLDEATGQPRKHRCFVRAGDGATDPRAFSGPSTPAHAHSAEVTGTNTTALTALYWPVHLVGRADLLRVNRRGFFHPLLLLSLFDRSRGGDYRLIQHPKIGKSASRSEPWS